MGKIFVSAVCLAVATISSAPMVFAQTTPYGSCQERSETYQTRYERSSRASDLVCFQKALEREMLNPKQFDCPRSADHYQSAYERNSRSSDLVCFQQALEREMLR